MAAPDLNVASLKLLIDPKSQRLLFAEAGKDFVDFLFSIMSLPVGTVLRLLSGKQVTAGCIGNIYGSIENLDDSYMHSAGNRDILLKPQAFNYGVYEPRLLPSMSPPTYTNFYRCSGYKQKDDCQKYMTNTSFSPCPSCNYYMSSNYTFVHQPNVKVGGFVEKAATYMVTDDLVVRPMSANTIISLLNQFNVKDVSDLEERVVAVGVNEGVELVRASMQSKMVLTDVFLGVKNEPSIKSEPI